MIIFSFFNFKLGFCPKEKSTAADYSLNPVESSESEKSFEKSSAAEKSEEAHFKAPVQITPESQNNPNQNQNQQGKKRRMHVN